MRECMEKCLVPIQTHHYHSINIYYLFRKLHLLLIVIFLSLLLKNLLWLPISHQANLNIMYLLNK